MATRICLVLYNWMRMQILCFLNDNDLEGKSESQQTFLTQMFVKNICKYDVFVLNKLPLSWTTISVCKER